jgi:hypothetical protein
MSKKFVLKPDGLKENDIFLFSDGRMCQFRMRWPNVDLVYVQFVDRDEETNFDPQYLDGAKNLGQSSEVLASFNAARGVHLRLNRFLRE